MLITLRQLEIFKAVVEEQQVTKASKKLFLTQSAVSLALNELESNLGGALFDRDSRSLILNDRGRYFLPLCREILYKAHSASELMNEKYGSIAGSLHVVASSTIGNYVLPLLASAFKKLHPNAFLTIQIHNTRKAEQLIIDRKVDVGFVERDVNNEQVLVSPWFDDELVVVANPNDVMAIRQRFSLARDLKKSFWVMREKGSGTAEIFKKKIGEYVTDLNVVMELGHNEAIKKAVEAGIGFGCLSSLVVSGEIDRGELKVLQMHELDMKRTMHIIQHKNKVTTRLMDEFVSFCRKMCGYSGGRQYFSSPQKIKTLLDQLKSGRLKSWIDSQ